MEEISLQFSSSAEEIRKICGDILPAANEVKGENFDSLKVDLQFFQLDSKEKLEVFLKRNLSALKEFDKNEAENALKIITNAPAYLVNKLKAGVCYSHVGLVRKAMMFEFGEKWLEYENRFSESRQKAQDKARSVAPPIRPHSIEKFFKYRDIDQTLMLLKSGTLAWSSPLLFNDPFDTQVDLRFDFEVLELKKPLFDRLIEIVTAPEEPKGDFSKLFFIALFTANKLYKEGRWSQQELRQKLEPVATQMTQNLQTGMEKNQQAWKEYLQLMRFLCLSTSNQNIPMWEHYANGGTGCVIEFTCPRDKASTFWLAKPINYSEGFPIIATLDEWIKHETGEYSLVLEDRFERYAFSKTTHWSYEEEWRIARVLKNTFAQSLEQKRDFLPFENTEIAAIYFGYRAKEEDIQRVIQIVSSKYPLLSCYRSKVDSNRGRLTFELINK